jgi:MFS family permease
MSDPGPGYKWIALSNTTLAMLLYSFNQTIVLVALPQIFAGLHADPLSKSGASYVLWVMSGYTVATTVLNASFGRIADIHGKVRFYNFGFVVFALGAGLCALTPSTGDAGALELIAFRIVQGVGGAMLAATSFAILTDAFPARRRGMAFATNQLAFIGGNIIGVVLGGLLAAAHWRLVFLVSVPLALGGAVWSYLQLKETGVRTVEPPDLAGNATFGAATLLLMPGLTYSLSPYGSASTGWGNPLVVALLAGGGALLVVFTLVASRVPYPMFNLALLRIRPFFMANLANVLFQVSRGGLQFMLIIWLQAVWLPLHGVSFDAMPLQAGLDLMPLMAGFLVGAPAGGWLADRVGARLLSTGGLLMIAASLGLLTTLPPRFDLATFGVYIFLTGIGMGLFSAPNSTQLMGSVPARYRGIAAGMRQTLSNAGQLLSTALFFTVVIGGLAGSLHNTLQSGLTNAGVPATAAESAAHVPAGSAVFASLLGYNPMQRLLAGHAAQVPHDVAVRVTDGTFFANLLARPLAAAMHAAFLLAASIAVAGAVASAFRGPQIAIEASPVAEVEMEVAAR